MADVDLISGYFGGADFDPLNAKGTLALNSFSYLLDGSPTTTPVPLPAGMRLLLAGLGGIAMVRGRRKA